MAKGTTPRERKCVMLPDFLEDVEYWINQDRKTAQRLVRIARETLRDPFTGIGKPEPLKHLGSDIWSRRLNHTDRIVYRVLDDAIHFLQARYHY